MAAFAAHFHGQDELVTIVPKVHAPELVLISKTIPPLKPPMPIDVPLWLASYLKKRDKCLVKLPTWLEPEHLESVLAEERSQRGQFTPLPFHYIEMAKELLSVASDDIAEPNRLRALIADIEDERRNKVQRGMQTLDERATMVQLPNVAAMEIAVIRDVATKGLDQMQAMDRAARAN